MQQAAANNERLAITGLLCFDGVHFLQYAEGPTDAVSDLRQRLRNSPHGMLGVVTAVRHAPGGSPAGPASQPSCHAR